MGRQATATLGDLLRQYRQRLGLSQEELAERVDPALSVTTVRNIERGRSRPYRHTLLGLCVALELTSEEQTAVLGEWRTVVGEAPSLAAPALTAGASVAPVVTPALVTAPHPAGWASLPASLTPLVGREHELATMRELLLRPETRLLSLAGAAGVGKTRLSLALATAVTPAFPDGVWLVELAALADPDLVHGAIAAALGLREEPGRSILITLVDHLRPMTGLVLLDNCEHLIGSCATLAAGVLRDCPDVRILATSREPLEVAGETIYRVPSLAAPDLTHPLQPQQMAGYASVQLFLQRAQSRRPDFTLSSRNARAVAEICARLDGIPLAIELAAARVGVLPVAGIAGRLDDRFRLLTKGARTALPRQQTLQAALDWRGWRSSPGAARWRPHSPSAQMRRWTSGACWTRWRRWPTSRCCAWMSTWRRRERRAIACSRQCGNMGRSG
jgi:DNA-binding XRE family transcriptional regulator